MMMPSIGTQLLLLNEYGQAVMDSEDGDGRLTPYFFWRSDKEVEMWVVNERAVKSCGQVQRRVVQIDGIPVSNFASLLFLRD